MSEAKVEPKSSKDVVPGDIVQIEPGKHRFFSGCFFVVTEVKNWGIQGYVQSFEPEKQGLAYGRFEWADFEPTGGKAIWWDQE